MQWKSRERFEAQYQLNLQQGTLKLSHDGLEVHTVTLDPRQSGRTSHDWNEQDWLWDSASMVQTSACYLIECNVMYSFTYVLKKSSIYL